MKFRSREINVFSMSALDLFASALGAFILISLVLMPYFLRPPTKFQFPHLDLVIALDTTGSMREEISGLQSEIVQLAQLLLKLSPSLGVGVIDFKDRCEGSNAVRTFPLRRMDPVELQALVSFVKPMSPGGSGCNGDAPEALAEALDTAVASNWRTESEWRVIIIITDSPAYEDRQHHALEAARQFAETAEQSKVSVALRGSYEKFLADLAEAGKGKIVPVGASFTASILLALME